MWTGNASFLNSISCSLSLSLLFRVRLS
jgi:hypothetical protein